MNETHVLSINNNGLESLDDYNVDSKNYINVHNKRQAVSPNIEFFHNNFESEDIDYNTFELRPILKKPVCLNYCVQSSSGESNYKDAVIFGTQINTINAIKQRQENLAAKQDFVAELALPLPTNAYETITIKINTTIKNQFIQKKCVEDCGGYYYDKEHQSIHQEEEFAIIKADLLNEEMNHESMHNKQKVSKKVRFV